MFRGSLFRGTPGFMLVLLLLSSGLAADQDVYPFETQADQERFQVLTRELRCPKCQNQNIADSDAPIATDMRDEVHRMINEGASDEEVVGALVERFGEFVRYKPTFDSRTAVLWLLPLIVVTVGIVVVATIVLRSRRYSETGTALSEEQRRQADEILKGRS